MMPENVIPARCRACVPPGSGEAWVRQSGNPVAILVRLAYALAGCPIRPARLRRKAAGKAKALGHDGCVVILN